MSIGWLDFSDEDRRKISEILQRLEEKSHLDELGLAPIRDGFADRFFPGMSTLINRAKYFLVVPYAMIDLERKPERNKSLRQRLQDIEKECCKKFLAGDDKVHIIGQRRFNEGGWVAQSPSDMYWGPLRHYGIFRKDKKSLANCLAFLKDYSPPVSRKSKSSEENEEVMDDVDAGRVAALSLWHPDLPYKPDWLNNLRIGLEPNEAEFLKKQILAKERKTMLGHILENNITQFTTRTYFKDLQNLIGLFPADIQIDYSLARAFSEFTFVLRTAFALVISKDQDQKALDWHKDNKCNLSEFANIDLKEIFARLPNADTKGLRPFLEKAREAMKRGDMDELKKIVAKREQDIKPRAKSRKTEPILDWSGRTWLDYRFSNCRNVVNDIFTALKVKQNA